MRWTLLFMLLCLATVPGAMASDNSMVLLPSDIEFRTTPYEGSLDDPQPDSLFYDNGQPSALIISTNFWARVRFTPQVDFTIISAYMMTIDANSTNAPCSMYVFTATPAPGGEQAVAIFAAPFPEFAWMDRNFNDSVTVNGGEDFWVVFGPIAGGPQGDGNWNPVYDNAATAGRSMFSTQGKFGAYTANNGDWLVRVGGIAGGVFTDLAAGNLYNSVGGVPKFNFPLGESLTLSQKLSNIGTQAADAYVVEFTITGPSGAEVYSEEVIGTNLVPGIETTHTTSSFTPATEGEYLAQCTALAGGDENAENNVGLLRFFVGGNDRWYRYDDDDGADSYTGFSAGNGWALKFEPGVWPARVTQIRMDMGGTGNADFRIWLNDFNGIPTFPPVWTATPAVVQGWNLIDINPPIDLFQGQGITLGYLFQTGVNMGYDTDPPNAGDNPSMDTISYQLAQNGTQFFVDDGGNLCMQVFFDTTTAAPPFPFINTDRTTIDFGAVNPNGGQATQSLWVYNLGSGGALNVTSISEPAGIAQVYDISPTVFSVLPLDSQEVTIIFDPLFHRAWNGVITINSNAQNDPTWSVTLLGTGDTTVSVRENNLPLPSEFALNQNYPNPFNPSTEIQFSLPAQSNVRLTVVNMLGQEVAVLADGRYSAGVYTASFDGANLPTGLYFYRMHAGDFTSVRKMMLIK